MKAPVLYRPPSEAKSLILEVTTGCAHNRCTFCSMYKGQAFAMHPLSDVLKNLQDCARSGQTVQKIFLAGGDALARPAYDLEAICQAAFAQYPHLKRISMYATVQDLLRKTPQELARLYQSGVRLLYVGLESGSDEVLKRIGKGITKRDFLEAADKAHSAGIKLSVTLIVGIGGLMHSALHAQQSAQAISAARPSYVSCLSLMLEPGTPLYEDAQQGRFTVLDAAQALVEMQSFIAQVDAPECVFRANHASNYLSLAGTFNRDKAVLIEQIEAVLSEQDFKPEFLRKL